MAEEAKIVLKDGTVIKITGGEDKKFSRASIYYDGDYKNEEEHSAIHINVSSENGKSYIDEHGKNHENQSRTHIDCFLTTACMEWYMNEFDDNCYELTILRWFRDNFVSFDDVKYYYKVAPTIVAAINENPKSDIIYYYIYENIIEYCIDKIIEGDYNLAYDTYKRGVLMLEKAFVNIEKDLTNVRQKVMIKK